MFFHVDALETVLGLTLDLREPEEIAHVDSTRVVIPLMRRSLMRR